MTINDFDGDSNETSDTTLVKKTLEHIFTKNLWPLSVKKSTWAKWYLQVHTTHTLHNDHHENDHSMNDPCMTRQITWTTFKCLGCQYHQSRTTTDKGFFKTAPWFQSAVQKFWSFDTIFVARDFQNTDKVVPILFLPRPLKRKFLSEAMSQSNVSSQDRLKLYPRESLVWGH